MDDGWMSALRRLGWLAGAGALAVGCGAKPETGRADTIDTAIPAGDARSGAGKTPETDDGAVTSPPEAPVPSEYEAEKAWAEARGVVIEPGKTTVVAKRRGDVARSTTYADSLVVFRSSGTIVRFVGTTKPAQMPNPASSVVPDVDGDGRKDLGIVRPGVYRALGDVTFGIPGHERAAFKIVTEDGDGGLPAWRDLSGDGDFSAAERALSAERGYRISGIYIHYGFAPAGTTIGGSTYVGPWSVGCQNVLYDELDSFVEAVGGATASFRFAIVDD
ncbi:MAG: hypothetical protein KF764_30960 [Labilithrix sp.]|nr:hypothetical protein [Labilithrix sp.]MBX3222355.1 hypothetical protein [Labilithrix sp.]